MRQETVGFELASTITLGLQANQLNKCASHPKHSLALKQILTVENASHKQHVQSAFVNRALMKSKEINPFYSNFVLDNSWTGVGEQNVTILWNLLVSDEIYGSNAEYETLYGKHYVKQIDSVKLMLIQQ